MDKSKTERAQKLGRRDGYLWVATGACDGGWDLADWLGTSWEDYWLARDEGEDGGPLWDAYHAAGVATGRTERERRELLRT